MTMSTPPKIDIQQETNSGDRSFQTNPETPKKTPLTSPRRSPNCSKRRVSRNLSDEFEKIHEKEKSKTPSKVPKIMYQDRDLLDLDSNIVNNWSFRPSRIIGEDPNLFRYSESNSVTVLRRKFEKCGVYYYYEINKP